jgi:hypothetical protein
MARLLLMYWEFVQCSVLLAIIWLHFMMYDIYLVWGNQFILYFFISRVLVMDWSLLQIKVFFKNSQLFLLKLLLELQTPSVQSVSNTSKKDNLLPELCRYYTTVESKRQLRLRVPADFRPLTSTQRQFHTKTPPRKSSTKRNTTLDSDISSTLLDNMDIIFGPKISFGNIHYGLLFTDHFSRMTYLYPLRNLTSDIPKQLEAFFAHFGMTQRCLITDFDLKLIGGRAREYLNSLLVHVNAAAAYRQE